MIPSMITNFIFELYITMRKVRRDEELDILYEKTLKEITDKYFSSSPWPESAAIASECQDDEAFLLFYQEMTFRHMTTKLKPPINDHIKSWHNYVKLFDFVIDSAMNNQDDAIKITAKWVYDITQEFAYQFQGFCQLRCQVAHHNAETARILEANKDAWNFPQVLSILNRLINCALLKQDGKFKTLSSSSPFTVLFGYFAVIEKARLDCLVGDFTSSLDAISRLSLVDRSECFMQIPVCHLNVFYHAGVCNMMIRKYGEAADIFSEVILYVTRILKPGSAANLRQGVPGQLQRMLDKVLGLTAIVITLLPNNRVDHQVPELLEQKLQDKIRKLQAGERNTFKELFEHASPKYITPLVPNYNTTKNIHQDASNHMCNVFMSEIDQQIPFLKLRSYFGLYASIDISKLARFNDKSETDLICLLTSLKHKTMPYRAGPQRMGSLVHYYIEDGVIHMDSKDFNTSVTAISKKSNEKFFIAGTRKNVEVTNSLNQTFAKLKI